MTQVNDHKSTGHTSFLNGDSLSTSAESLRLQAQRSLLLNRITTQLDSDYDQQINRALSLIRRAFELDFVIVSQIKGADYTVKYIAASQDGIETGQILNVDQMYCELVYNANEIVVINHVSESEYVTHPCFGWSQLESYAGAPLHVDDTPYGTVAFSNIEARPAPFTDIDLEFLQIFTNWVSGVLSRKNAAEGLQHAVDNMTQLYQFTSILNQATTVEELFLTAIRHSIETGATFANLFTIQVDHDNQPEFADMVTSWSASGETPLPPGTRLTLSDFEISKYWIASRKPVFVSDVQNDERITEAARAIYRQVGAEATITYPLILQNQWVGVMSINWPQVRQFTEADRQQYETMSHQTAAVLHNLIYSEHEHKRAQALETVSKVSTAVSSILNVPELLKTVVNLTKEQFDLYHAHLYLVDQETNQLRLASGAGDIGKQMVSEGRVIALNAEQSLVARAARSTNGFIVNDVANEVGFLPHPLLPHTASELAVPIISGEEVLGVLDVQAAQINYFTEDDLDILNTLAAQIAPALQNARAFEQLRTARAESEKAQDRTEAILKSTTLPLVITRVSDGLALYANEPLARAIRIPLDEIIGRKSPNFYTSPEDRQLFLQSIMTDGYIENYELQLVRSDGDTFWALVSARLFDYEGETAIVSTLADITDRKQAEERTETILTSVNLPLAITRISDGYGMYANEPFGEVFHMSVDEFIGRRSPDFYADPADRAGLLKGVHEVGYTRNYETRLKRNDGKIFWALMSARAIEYEGHASIMTTIIDITERKDAAEALRRSQEDLEAILEYSPEAIGLLNTQTGLFENPNTRAEVLYGLSYDELIKVGPAHMSPEFQPDGRPSAESAMEKIGEALQGGNPVFEWTHINSKGENIPCEVRLVSLGDDRSHLVRFSVTDISERKKAAEALRRSQEEISAILESSPEAIGVVNTQTGLFESPNKKAELLYGLSHDELINVGPAHMSPEFQPDGRASGEAAMEKIGEALQGGSPVFEWMHINSEGAEIFCEVRLSGIGGDRAHLVRFSVTDISERKALEEELRLLQQAFTASTQPITIADMRQEDQPLVYINPAFEQKTGYTRDEVIGKNCRFLQAEDTDQEGLTTLRQAIKAGEPCAVEIRNYRKDGTMFWNQLNLSPVKNAIGEVTHFIGSQQDVTERRDVEARLAKQAADLATVAEVSTAVSTIQNVDDMLQTVVDLTKARFNLYHAHIFTYQPETQDLVLRAGADEIGRQMVTEGRRIPLTADDSLVATVGRTKAGQIRHYSGEMEGYAPHPALIDTRTELAVPLVVGNELLGVLDVRSEMEHAFTETDIQIQTTLASQIAVALQNVRSFEQMHIAQAELQTSSEFLDAVLSAIPNPVFVKDQEHRWLLLNDTMCEWMGQPAEHFLGKSDYEFFPKEQADIFWEMDQRVFQSDQPVINEELFTDATGFTRTIVTTKVSHKLDAQREILIGSILDVTDLKAIESELRASQTQLEAILNNLPVGVFVANAQTGVPELANPAALELLGRGLDPDSGATEYTEVYQTYRVDVDEPIPAEELPLVKTMTTGEINHGQLDIIRPDDRITVDVTSVPIFNENDTMTSAIALFQDITERRSSQAELILQNSALEAAANGIAITDLNGQFIRVNTAFTELTGYTAEEVIGQSTRILKSGQQAPEFYKEMWETVIDGDVWHGELINKRKDGSLYTEEMTITPVRAANNEITHFIAIKQDVTERKAAAEVTAKQAAELQMVAQIGIAISSSLDTNTLLQEVTDLTKESFGLYHAHIYLLDETEENLKLTAGAGQIGQKMVSQSRSISLKAQSLVAQAARTGQATIANNVLKEPNFLPNPLLPKTRSEMAIPIIFGGAVLGVLDVQANTVNRFTQQDINIQTTLATEIAVAIENARQYEATQEANNEISRLYEITQRISVSTTPKQLLEAFIEPLQYQGASYSALLTIETDEENIPQTITQIHSVGINRQSSFPDGTRFDLSAFGVSDLWIHTGDIVLIGNTATDERIDQATKDVYAQSGAKAASIYPLKVGTEWVGVLTINWDEPQSFTKDDLRFFQSLTDQMAVALNGYNLLQQTQAALTRVQQANTVIQNSPAILFRWDALSDYAVEIVSENIARFGYTPEELLSGEIDYATNIVHPDDLPEVLAEIDKYLEDDPDIPGFNQEYRIITKDGKIRWVDDRTTVIRNAEGMVTHLEGVVIDSTNRRLAEAETIRRAQELATVAEVSTAVSSLQNSQEMLQTVVDLAKERFGLYHAHVFLLDEAGKGLNLTAGAGDVGREMVEEGRQIPVTAEGSLVATAARTRQPQIRNYEGEMEGYSPHPALIDTRTEMAVPLLAGNQLLGILDIRSEQENAFGEIDIQIQSTLASQVAIALQNAQQYEETQTALGRLERANTVIQSSPAILFRWRAVDNWPVEFVSDNIARFGYTPEELLSGETPYATVIHPDDLMRVAEEVASYSAEPGRTTFSQEYRIITKNGEVRWTDDRTNIVRDAEGNVTHYEGIVLDSTDRKEAEAETARRAQELATVAEVSTAVSSLQDSQEMLQTVVGLTKDRFDLYHAHAFLMDDAGETLLLTAGAGDIGREMVTEGRRIPIAAEGSLVATAARTRQPQIRNYGGEMEGYAPHPALIETRTEMAVPLLAGETLLGVIDVRSTQENAFGDIDVQIQSTLASQVAIALQNTRQFEQTERARRELAVITQRLTREGWEDFLVDRDEAILRYGYNLQAVQTLDEDQFITTTTGSTMSAPLVVQDTELGQLAVELPEEPDNDTAEIIMSVVSNLSAHIENIRLNEQTFKALADTESLYHAINQIVRAKDTNAILHALVESTIINQMDRANLFMFSQPWDDIEPEYAIVDALWEQGRDVSESLAPSGTIYNINQITTIRSFKRDEVVVYNDILTDERVDPLSRQNLSNLGTRTLYVFPLIVNQQWIGSVTAQASEANYEISETNLRQISTLTEQAATTIANRRLLAQAQERVERERRVRAITDRIRSGANREDILKIAREEIGNLLGASKSVVQLGTKQQLVSKLSKRNGHD